MKHHTEDSKQSAINYYLNNIVSIDDVCKIYELKKSFLKCWVYNYNNRKTLSRKSRQSISYKITQKQVDYAINLIEDSTERK